MDTLVSDYGYQWTDTSAPILNDQGASEISFNIYSSKNASEESVGVLEQTHLLHTGKGVNLAIGHVRQRNFL